MKALRIGGNVAASRRGTTSGDSDNNNTMQPKVGSTEEPPHRNNSGLRRLSGVTFKDDVDLEALAKTASFGKPQRQTVQNARLLPMPKTLLRRMKHNGNGNGAYQ